MTRHLVIGASGQVGRRIFEILNARGDEVVGTFLTRPREDMVRCDLGTPSEAAGLVERVKPQTVVLVGGITNVDASQEDPARALRVNAEGTEAVAAAAKRVGAHMTFFSTDYVFPGESGPVDESATPRPLSEYGRSKLEGEKRAGPEALIIRSANVYSYTPGDRNFFMQMYEGLKAGRTFHCFTDQWGTPTYAPALAEATVEAVDARRSGVLHLAGPDYVSRIEWGRAIAMDFGFDANLVIATTTAQRPQKAPRPPKSGLKSARRGHCGPGLREAHRIIRAWIDVD